MENAVRLIGPQLKDNRTTLETTETGKWPPGRNSVLPQVLLLPDFNTNSAISNVFNNQVEAEIAVQRGAGRPAGPIHLATENATVVTDWATAAGTGAYPGKPLVPQVSPGNVQTPVKPPTCVLPLGRFCPGCIVELQEPQHFIGELL